MQRMRLLATGTPIAAGKTMSATELIEHYEKVQSSGFHVHQC